MGIKLLSSCDLEKVRGGEVFDLTRIAVYSGMAAGSIVGIYSGIKKSSGDNNVIKLLKCYLYWLLGSSVGAISGVLGGFTIESVIYDITRSK